MAKFTFCDFAMGRVVIDFRNYTMEELKALRALCRLIEPECKEPAYSFCACYYVEPKHCRWYEGGPHNFVGKNVCRATEIILPFEVAA
ncbi:hypothetical protein EXN61_11455 [Agrobacterium tumefaciens]|uniref:Uncharacterized protein n=1 Tax=Agrobacterium tumefaciens TaxID=358 RepID=A0A546XYM5_AGRTU|nr:hypothetical protein [Agrobacterium tumefaciens]TRB05843.1 hypothetical protein EXN61_11455 [Agrobacterium tumefaciens]